MSRIIVTGGAGFIGSNIVESLSNQGYDVVVVDYVDDKKFKNLAGIKIKNIIKPSLLVEDDLNKVDALIHMGASSSTASKGDVIGNNYKFSKKLLNSWLNKRSRRKKPFIYASSASIYGLRKSNIEFADDFRTKPLNLYGYSKWLFDEWYFNEFLKKNKNYKIMGLRLFNVYGPKEFHKDQPSPHFKFFKDIIHGKDPVVFTGENGFGGDAFSHKRDFVHIEDVVSVVDFFLKKPRCGIFNVGSGKSHTFYEVANKVIESWNEYVEKPKFNSSIKFKTFPESMAGNSQPFSKADLGELKRVGYLKPMIGLESGTRSYVNWLLHNWDYFK